MYFISGKGETSHSQSLARFPCEVQQHGYDVVALSTEIILHFDTGHTAPGQKLVQLCSIPKEVHAKKVSGACFNSPFYRTQVSLV